MELQRTEAIIKMVKLNFGVTILPEAAVKREVRRGKLYAVPVRDLDLRWEFGLAYLKSDYIPPAVGAFIKLCRAYLSEHSTVTSE